MNVMIAEDDTTSRLMLESLLTDCNYTVTAACDGNEAWEILRGPDPPNIMVLDWVMPGMDGIEIISRLKEVKPANPYYTIIVTGDCGNSAANALNSGADDFVTKPYNADELKARVAVGCRMVSLQNSLLRIAETDCLTNLPNRRSFENVLNKEHARHARSGANLSLIMLDIDHFKSFNDNYGHVSGDQCLQRIAWVIADCCARPADLPARYGGEEFACILPETYYNGAVAIAEEIRRGILDLTIPHKGSSVSEYVTASLGVVSIHCAPGDSANDIVTQADKLLYLAKSNGRNRVEFMATNKAAMTSSRELNGNFIQLEWKDSFCCGNQLIDSQHHSLFQLSNQLLEKILSSRPSTEIIVLISRLIDHVGQHFHDEEAILESISYHGTIQHAKEHAKLLAKCLELSQTFTTSTLSVGEAFQFLAYEVIMQHMLGADREFFKFISNTDVAEPDSP